MNGVMDFFYPMVADNLGWWVFKLIIIFFTIKMTSLSDCTYIYIQMQQPTWWLGHNFVSYHVNQLKQVITRHHTLNSIYIKKKLTWIRTKTKVITNKNTQSLFVIFMYNNNFFPSFFRCFVTKNSRKCIKSRAPYSKLKSTLKSQKFKKLMKVTI